jgi:small subunit ribosomal protein S20
MANTKSAKKRIKQNKKRRLCNLARRSAIKTATKKVLDALEARDITAAKALLVCAEAQIARACGKRVIKKNTAARKVGGLTKRIAKLEGGK